MKPVIAMPQTGNGLFRRYMKSKYVKSLERADAQVCWIALDDPDKAVAQMLEAFLPTRKPILCICRGVQWHPEHMSQNDPVQQRLFDAFVSACQN